jgi:hypothetical protein
LHPFYAADLTQVQTVCKKVHFAVFLVSAWTVDMETAPIPAKVVGGSFIVAKKPRDKVSYNSVLDSKVMV